MPLSHSQDVLYLCMAKWEVLEIGHMMWTHFLLYLERVTYGNGCTRSSEILKH